MEQKNTIRFLILQVLSAALVPGALCDFRQTGLEVHNEIRKLHGSPMMTLSDDLNSKADKCAEYYAKKGTIDHTCPHKKGAGENLYKGASSATGSDNKDNAVTNAVNSFYAEIKDYNCDSLRFDPNTGHFTQVVWKKSTQLGIGYFKTSSNKGISEYVVALYLERGNDLSTFKENVPSSLFSGNQRSADAPAVKSNATTTFQNYPILVLILCYLAFFA